MKWTTLFLLVVFLGWSSSLIASPPAGYESFTLRANDKLHHFRLADFPQWTLRARLPRFQTAALSLTIVDEGGTTIGSIIETPGRVTGGAGRHVQYRLPKRYLDPFFIVFEDFTPGKNLTFGLQTERLAYCNSPIPLGEKLAGFEAANRGPKLTNAYLDPVLGISSATLNELTWADGDYSIIRYFVRPKKRVIRAGYLFISHREKTYKRLFATPVSAKNQPKGTLFDGNLLSLSKVPNELPYIYELTEKGLKKVHLPRRKIGKKLAPLQASSLYLKLLQKREGVLGALVALTFYIESPSGVHLLRVRTRKGKLVHYKLRELTPKERKYFAPPQLYSK